MGKIVAICISEKKGTNKIPVKSGNLIEDFGLETDAHGGFMHRQISLLAKEDIDLFNNRGGNVVYGDFGENLVTEGIDFTTLKLGDKLKIGDSVLEISQFGKECHDRCEIFYRVGECIMPKLGVFSKVVVGGKIDVDDVIDII